ncbi:MAG: AEC family transporter [Vicinamibacterales bacterium]
MHLFLSIFANDVLPIFIVTAAGFLFARVLGGDVRTLSRVTFNVLSPCLVFTLLVTSEIGAGAFARMTAAAVIVVLATGITTRAIALPMGMDRQTLSALLLVVMFSNNGNYGLPVVLFAFGQEAMAQASVYFVANAVLTYTLGVFLASAGRRSAPDALRGVLRVPAVYGVVAAALVMTTGARPPLAVERAVALLADAAVPLMIFVLGMQLDRGAWPKRPALVALAACLSLVVMPMVAVPVSHLLGLTEAARQAAVVQAGMPSAVLTTIIANEFDVAPDFVTACVLVSTLASTVSVTLLILYLR